MTIIGGLRVRLIHDSLAEALRSDLAGLGWFDAGRHHLPLTFEPAPRLWDEPITANIMVISINGADFELTELGSNLGLSSMQVRIDLYTENDSFGTDITNDIRDVLRGRLGSAIPGGRLPVYDYQQATPTVITYVGITDITISRNTALAQRDYARHTYQVECHLEDSYYGYNS